MAEEKSSMKQYGGFKLIQSANPMKARDAKKAGHRVGNHKPSADGYEVEYDTGYKAWSPKDVFDAAYDAIGGDDINPVHKEILRFFAFSHLPAHLQAVSAPFTALAWRIARRSKDGREGSVAIRKLLEAKDAAVRACL